MGSGAVDTGSAQIAIGQNALNSLTDGTTNTAIGYRAGSAMATGSNNTILGYDALKSATYGDNVAIGYLAAANITGADAHGNTVVGTNALATSTAQSEENVVIGKNAMYGTELDVDKNVAIGAYALDTAGVNTEGTIAIGAGAMGSAFTVPCVDNNNNVILVGTHLEDEVIEEAIRMDFVAMTRAKEKLFIITDDTYLGLYHHEKFSEFETDSKEEEKITVATLNSRLTEAYSMFVAGKMKESQEHLKKKETWLKDLIIQYFKNVDHFYWSAVQLEPFGFLKKTILQMPYGGGSGGGAGGRGRRSGCRSGRSLRARGTRRSTAPSAPGPTWSRAMRPIGSR